MITKNKHSGMWDISCDACPIGTLEVEAEDFRGAVAAMKEEGWTVTHTPEGWVHLCGDCI